jgi:lipoprotein-anchoring transpeptidase ErfK/SrfK
MVLPIAFYITLFCMPIQGCNQSDDRQISDRQPEVNIPVSVPQKDSAVRIPSPFRVINYRLDTIKTIKDLLNIKKKYERTPENYNNYRAFTLLNRKELRYISKGSAIVIPDTLYPDLKAYSIFPLYYPGAKDLKKIILVSNKYQCYGAYENGYLVRFAAVNSGKERTPSFPGRYALNWKKLLHHSSIDSTWVMPYTFNFHTEAGSAFHQFEMPGKPASHSCLRQFEDDAKWLFSWGLGIRIDSVTHQLRPMSGTPVIILDHYDFTPEKGYSWKYLKSNKDVIVNLPKDPMAVEEALIPMCQIPKNARGNLRDYKRFVHAEDTLRAHGIIRPGVKLIETRNFNKERRLKELAKQKKELRLKQQ